MKAVILAAGQGIRVRPLSLSRPKPLIKILDQTILEHNLNQLKGIIKEVILVVGYKGEMIKEKIGSNWKGIKINYLWQEILDGTGRASCLAVNFLEDKFLLLNGDDFYFQPDIKNLMKKFPAILVKEVSNPENFGVVLEKDKRVVDLIENPEKPKSNLINTGCYFLPKEIFKFKIKKSKRGEYEFTDYIKKFIKKEKLNVVHSKHWIPLSYSWDLFEATEFLLRQKKGKILGKVEKNVQIFGKVIIEKGAQIRSGSYLLGPLYIGKNSIVGPNCFLRAGTVIGDNCKIGQGVEIKNSLIGERTQISHLSYVGDSIIGENCNLGAGTILANWRFDQKSIKVKIEGKIIDTKRKKLGAIIGDDVKIGVNCSLMPGILIGPGAILGPHSFVKKNIEAEERYYSQFKEVREKL